MKRRFGTLPLGSDTISYSPIHKQRRNERICNGILSNLPTELVVLIQKYDNDFTGECVYTQLHVFRGPIRLTIRNDIVLSVYHHLIYMWNLVTGTELCVMKKQNGCVRHLLKLQNGNMASASDDGSICIWDLSRFMPILTITGHQDWIWFIIQLQDSRIVSASSDNTVRIWNINSGECEHILVEPKSWVTSLVQCKSTGHLFASTRTGEIYQWVVQDTETPTLIKSIQEYKGWVRSMISTSSGEILIGYDGGYISLWDIKTECRIYTIRIFSCILSQMTLIPNGYVAIPQQNNIVIFDISDGKQKYILRQHSSPIQTLQLLSNGDLLSSDKTGKIHIWK